MYSGFSKLVKFKIPPLFLTGLLISISTLTFITPSSEAKKVLFFNGYASHSHLVAFEPLAKKLADRGHNVTILSTMFSEDRHPKIRHYCPKSALDMQDELISAMGQQVVLQRLESKFNDFIMQTSEIWEGQSEVCGRFYNNPEFRDWMKSEGTFDLVVMDAFSRECALPLAHIWKAKSIIFSPSTLFYPEPDSFGFDNEASWQMPWESPGQSGILEAFRYEIVSLSWFFWREWTYIPKFDQLVQSSFPEENVPKIKELQKATDLYFVNLHYSYEIARSLPPFVIPVGGMHCKDGKSIADNEIRRFVEHPAAADGFIYISYGSFLQISSLPPEVINIFFKTINSFPKMRFLWKWEGKIPKDVPKNVIMSKWFKQQDILAHPKCRGFISQGGLMSFQQAIHHGVPVIIMPGGADQVLNARIAAKFGFGIHLEFSDVTLESFESAVRDLLENPKYMKKMKEVSKLSKDRPMSALDTAVWWTEYVLRHEDLSHLKTPGIHQTWWQRRLLHLWALVFTALLISTSLMLTILYFSCKIILRKSVEKSEDRKSTSTSNKKNK